MTFTLHHLQRSQSERIVWLCEELGIPYELKTYRRDQQTLLAPPELKALHPAGSAPVLTDGDVTIAESGAIAEYIINRYAPPSHNLTVPASAPAKEYAEYLYWLHFANGSLQPTLMIPMMISFTGLGSLPAVATHPSLGAINGRVDAAFKALDARLRETGNWLAGDKFTLADIMTVFTMSTMRLFEPFSLDGYDGIVAWLERVGRREAYQRAIEKGEKGETRGVVPTLMREAPKGIRSG
ncbi:uncharacterized protein K452DRAFT_55253 [Aplosporella prunicola CBS 121167]|uniref:glutathione transferase n=1 Tax=Aplosporella prunicola CBS 121167 TaxID=1176127 RepID=A0A6A6B8B8_9PEZI|nr:uncharacterized protein K452DRAFT_55253 [Aplosporella prunicola CBS 121167]KAF2140399.1 hypothetical protein K452DRAFT_55253 [Aplosporella prunicola CBS 121167]